MLWKKEKNIWENLTNIFQKPPPSWVIVITQNPSNIIQFSSIQSLTHVRLTATPWTAACQASLSITNSPSLLKLMSIESVMPSNHLILRQYYWTTLICTLTETLPTTFERLKKKEPKLLLESRISFFFGSFKTKEMLADHRNSFQKFPCCCCC